MTTWYEILGHTCAILHLILQFPSSQDTKLDIPRIVFVKFSRFWNWNTKLFVAYSSCQLLVHWFPNSKHSVNFYLMGSSKKLTILKPTLLLTCIALLILFLQRMVWPSNLDFSAPKFPQADGFEQWLFEQGRRKARIARVCGNKTKRRQNDKFGFYFNEEHNLLFCNQPKVGLPQFISCIMKSGAFSGVFPSARRARIRSRARMRLSSTLRGKRSPQKSFTYVLTNQGTDSPKPPF